MTIAGVYLCPEGVVLGADSTSSYTLTDGSVHYLNHTQKLFEIGVNGSLGAVIWGLAGIENAPSYRTLFALLADDFKKKPPADLNAAAVAWINRIWPLYSASPGYLRHKILTAMHPFGATTPAPAGVATRTEAEDKECQNLGANLRIGFCLAGHVSPGRTPEAAVIELDPGKPKPTPSLTGMYNLRWFGFPGLFRRLTAGIDAELQAAIQHSPKWTGTAAELDALVANHSLLPVALPIRDAIDYLYSCIFCTIKAIKFSTMPQVCGGPIELAVITTDRQFRWVRHKAWDAAITEGEQHGPA